MFRASPSPSPSPIAAAGVAVLAALLLAACADTATRLPTAPRGDVAVAAASPNAQKADLTVQAVSHAPTSPGPTDPMTFSATVANVGTHKANRFDVQFDFGTGTPQVVTVAGGLAAGASVQLSVTQTLPAGLRTATVTADYGDRIRESDETNNAATNAYYVRAANTITFETDASGNPVCAQGCDVTTDYANFGVTFSFQSGLDENGNPLTTQTNASICDGSRIDPPDLVASGNHLVTGPMGYPCGGGYAGVMTMTFGASPTSVQFALRAPTGCNPSPISATSGGATAPAVSYTTTQTYEYNGTGLLAIERVVRVTSPTGVATVGVNTSGCDHYVDDLLITP